MTAANNWHYDIACKLLENGRFNLWLSPAEGRVFVRACSDSASWRAFMTGKLIPEKKGAIIHPPPTCEDVAPVPFSVVAAARIRQMIFEQLIPGIFPQNREQCTALAPPPPPTPYGLPPMPIYQNHVKSDQYEINDDVDDGSDVEQPYSSLPALNLDVPIDDVYYTFDYDAELMVSEPDDDDVCSQRSESPQVQDATQTARSPVDVHSSLKYLFMAVKEADGVRIDSIKQLLDEVRPSRSKWASDNIGQEELYLSLEKALADLKAYSAHSIPFLQPVNKREVPDYYDVIKHPMDLGTMTTKLQRHQYMSKNEFADDLALIWNNCLQYNLHPPDNIYRKHANAMRRKTNDVLKKIPEIEIVLVTTNEDQDSEDEYGMDATATCGGKFEQGLTSLFVAVPEDGTPAPKINGHAPEESEQTNGHHLDVPSAPNGLEHTSSNGTLGGEGVHSAPAAAGDDVSVLEPVAPQVTPRDHPPPGTDMVIDLGSMQERQWKHVAAPIIRQRNLYRAENVKRKFEDRLALIPTPESLGASVADEQDYVRRNKKRRLDYAEKRDAATVTREVIDEDDYRHIFEESYFPEIKYPAGCVPALRQPPFAPRGREEDPALLFEDPSGKLSDLPSVSDYPEINQKPKGALEKQVHQNIRELQRVKELHAKIVAREAEVPYESERKPIPPYQPPKHKDPLPPLIMNREVVNEISKQTVAKMLLHAGFDVASEPALATLTDTFSDYFLNLGKSMRLFQDKFSRTMSSEEILTHALEENGVEKPAVLDKHVRLDIDRYGDKLTLLRRKLAYGYKDLTKDDEEPEGDIDEEEIGDDFVSGNFFDLDILHLKDLGIEGFTSVPKEVWNKKSDKPKPIRARVRRRTVHREEEVVAPQETVGKPSALPWRPVRYRDTIGLLKPYYRKRIAARDLIEDEYKTGSKRSKVHLGAAKMGRKKAIGISTAQEDAAKKKRGKGPDPAIKAQREAEKLRKAQEKAEKQKQRLELANSRKAKVMHAMRKKQLLVSRSLTARDLVH
ncbi:Transcriptional activator spt7 [Geranomyces michiganensis]|nr:Transcriptional activator spt7 [Geranomyces michiganensis]